MESRRDGRLPPAWWTVMLLAVLALIVSLGMASFQRSFEAVIPVTLTSDRAGLVMEPGARVKLRGVQVGRVSVIEESPGDSVRLNLEMDPDQVEFIPANVGAEIRATTIFGAKYVELIYPSDPSEQRLIAGAQIQSQNVSTEVNTVFENLIQLLEQVEPGKLNSVLAAVSEGLGGKGLDIGQAIADANQVLLALNPRAETVRRDWRSLRGFSDTYSAAAQNIIKVLDALGTTSSTISANESALDALLTSVIGFSESGANLLAPNKDNLVRAVNDLAPTTALLLKYNPELTCTLVGGWKTLTDYDWTGIVGGNGYGGTLDGAFSFGDDPYKYPDNLPITGARGGPGGKPGCGSLPDVSMNWPVRQIVTNTGWGTGLDWRPNPGIGFPGWANYFPVSRAAPEPPSIRYPDGQAPGPAPAYPGGPPHGAPQYAADGTPLYPGLPPGIPSASPPPDPSHLPPGAEPPS